MSLPSLLPPAAADAVAFNRQLAGYVPTTSVLVADPTRTLCAAGPALPELGDVALAELADRADAVLAEAGGLIAGAISFDGHSTALRHSTAPSWSQPLQPTACFRCGHEWYAAQEPLEADFRKAVTVALERIAADDVRKVVLARSILLHSARRLDPATLVAHLAGRGTYTYAVPLPGERLLMGLSPELLISRRGTTVTTNPLAGSVARSADPDVNQLRAQRLRTSSKDLAEHQLVVDQVVAALRPLCSRLQVGEPEVIETATMLHLSTRISGELADPDISSLRLAAALHPTPAVCGSPTPAARALITELEPVERGFYAGLVGWQDASGDGTWALALRCAVLEHSHRLRLWAGAGIVADSDPDSELAETSAKFATALLALGYHGHVP